MMAMTIFMGSFPAKAHSDDPDWAISTQRPQPTHCRSSDRRRGGNQAPCQFCRRWNNSRWLQVFFVAGWPMQGTARFGNPMGSCGLGDGALVALQWEFSSCSIYGQSDGACRRSFVPLARFEDYSASLSVSPVRMRTACSSEATKILPSPIWPVRAAAVTASTA